MWVLLLAAIGLLSTPPNIVVVLIDDLGWQDVSLPLHTEPTPLNRRYRTPNLERLAARGMRFTNAYAAAPVCTPTRTSIMSGQDPGRTHITYWTLHRDRDTSREHPRLRPPKWNMNGLQRDDVTLPKLLRDAGYRTIHAGKAHFGAHDTSGADPRNLGFEVNIAGHASGGPGSYLGVHNFTAAGRRGKLDGEPSVWDVPGLEAYHGKDIYLTEALTLEAIAEVEKTIDAGRPFFLYFAPYAVHTPIMANTRYLENYDGLDKTEAAYATMIESYDTALGDIMAMLQRRGVAERTIVFFTSDNGGLSATGRGGEKHTHNAPLRSGKGSAYEGGIRVPAVIAWPGVTPPASVSHTPIVSQDLFPTILAMTGVTTHDVGVVDGRDLSPLLRNEAVHDPDRVIVWHQPHQWGARGPGIEPFTAIRKGDWKLIYFHADERFELYDLGRDISEAHDLASDERERVRTLAGDMDAWIERTDAQLSIDKQTGEPVSSPAKAAAGSVTP